MENSNYILAAMVEWLRCSTRNHKLLCSNLSITIHGMTLDKSLTQVIAARSETAGTDRFLATGFRAGIRRIIPTSSYQTRSDPSSSDGFHWTGFRHCLCRRSSDDFRHGFSRNFAGTSPAPDVPESGCKDPTGTGWN